MNQQPFLNSWKTTILGIAKACCLAVIAIVALTSDEPGPIVASLIGVMAALDAGQGIASRDADKSSQDAGIR